jgi:hypothetical protein
MYPTREISFLRKRASLFLLRVNDKTRIMFCKVDPRWQFWEVLPLRGIELQENKSDKGIWWPRANLTNLFYPILQFMATRGCSTLVGRYWNNALIKRINLLRRIVNCAKKSFIGSFPDWDFWQLTMGTIYLSMKMFKREIKEVGQLLK